MHSKFLFYNYGVRYAFVAVIKNNKKIHNKTYRLLGWSQFLHYCRVCRCQFTYWIILMFRRFFWDLAHCYNYDKLLDHLKRQFFEINAETDQMYVINLTSYLHAQYQAGYFVLYHLRELRMSDISFERQTNSLYNDTVLAKFHSNRAQECDEKGFFNI